MSRNALPVMLVVLLRAGLGQAQPVDVPFRTHTLSPHPICATTAIGDLDDDGLPDIVIAQGHRNKGWTPVLAWLRAPDWQRFDLNPPALQDIRAYPDDSALADINHDGRLDLVFGTADSRNGRPHEIYWFENPGGEATGLWKRHLVAAHARNAYHPADILVGDLDRDGKNDIVAKDLFDRNSFQCTLRIYFQDTPSTWIERNWTTDYREGMRLGDLDRDGRLDIVCNGYWYATPPDARTDSFQRFDIDPFHYTQDNQADSLSNSTKNAVGDLNGDGRSDVVLATAEGQSGYLAWYEAPQNPRTQPWIRHKIQNIQNCHQCELGDFDNDGDLDIFGGLAMKGKGVYLWLNNGSGASFTRRIVSSVTGIYSGEIGDLGSDGDLDIVGPHNCDLGPLNIHENLLTDSAKRPPTR